MIFDFKKIKIQDLILHLLFLGLGLFLFYSALRGTDYKTIVHYFYNLKRWPLVLIALTTLSAYLIRTYRWKLLMDTEGKSNFWNLFFAIHASYLASLFIPRIGEILKCVVTSKVEHKSIAFIIGTTVIERIADVSCYFIMLMICLFIKFDFIVSLFLISTKDITGSAILILAVTGIALCALGYIIYKKIEEKKLIHQVRSGLLSIGKIKNKFGFIISSIAIFFSYFLTSYLAFSCFDSMAHLGPLEGYLVMIAGTFTKMLPISGSSMGAYHLVVQNVLNSFGIGNEVAVTYAIVNHGLQLMYNIILGIVSYLILSAKLRSSPSLLDH